MSGAVSYETRMASACTSNVCRYVSPRLVLRRLCTERDSGWRRKRGITMAGVLFRTVIRCRYGSMTLAAVAMYLDEFLEEMIPLIAEDLRTARARLGITSARAAKRARLDAARSRALEKGAVQRSQHTIALMVSVARSLSLKSIRASYADEIGQYMRIDLSTDRPLTTFVDNLEVDVTQLKEQGHFVSPYGVLALVEPTGFYTTFESSSPSISGSSNCGSRPYSRLVSVVVGTTTCGW